MSPIEAFREGLRNGGGYMDCTFRQLEGAISALEQERDAAKASAEKAEAERDTQAKDSADNYAECERITAEKMDLQRKYVGVARERDALRKALQSVLRLAEVEGDSLALLTVIKRRAHAALHGTAKQDKPRTCGECAKIWKLKCPRVERDTGFGPEHDDEAPEKCFQPRADAQKGQP